MKEMAQVSKRRGPVRVFLSYAEADSVLAEKVRNVLSRHLSVSTFLHSDLSAGRDWQARLRKELERADVFAAVLSPNSIGNSWVLQETGAAWALEKPIIPIVTNLNVLDRFPIQFRSAPALKTTDLDTVTGSARFAKAVEQALTSEVAQ